MIFSTTGHFLHLVTSAKFFDIFIYNCLQIGCQTSVSCSKTMQLLKNKKRSVELAALRLLEKLLPALKEKFFFMSFLIIPHSLVCYYITSWRVMAYVA